MMAGTLAVELDNHVMLEMDYTQALAGPPPALFQWEGKIKFILVKLHFFFSFLHVHPNLILILLCV